MARQLVIELVGRSDKFTKSLGDAEKATKGFGDKVGAAGKKMSTFVSVPIVGFLGAATKAGVEEAAQMDNLAKVLENTTGATKAQVKAVEEQIGAWQKASSFSDGEMRPAFEDLVIATGDVTAASKLMSTALDIATATGKPLEQVTEALAKAQNGQVGALGRLGIATRDASGEMLSLDQIVRAANETYGGAAQRSTETTAGKMKQLQMTLGDLTEDIGKEVIPVVERLVGMFTGLFDWLNNVGIGADKLLIALLALATIGPVLTLIGNLVTIVKALQAAFLLLAANPIVLVIAGIVALGAALVLAYQKSETFRNIVDGAVRAVGDAAIWVKDRFVELWHFIRDLPGKIKNAVKGVAGDIAGMIPGSGVVGSVIGKVGSIFGRAAGGPVAAGRPYVVGEAGPELFVPGRSGSIVPNRAMGGGGATVVNINVGGSVITERDLGRIVADALRDNRLYGVTS